MITKLSGKSYNSCSGSLNGSYSAARPGGGKAPGLKEEAGLPGGQSGFCVDLTDQALFNIGGENYLRFLINNSNST